MKRVAIVVALLAVVAVTAFAPATAAGKLSMWRLKTYIPPADKILDTNAQECAKKAGVELAIQTYTFDDMWTKYTAAIESRTLPDIAELDAVGPRELEEAALVDGATRMQALVRVVLPLAAPGLLAAGLFCFTLSWNEFLDALIFIADDSLKTLPVGLSEFVVSDFAFWGQLMAAATLASLPVIVVYIYLHKYMVQGLTAGAVKG
jgi:binding-protein-dependent transport system inner membrane component